MSASLEISPDPAMTPPDADMSDHSGVINVTVANADFSQISGEVSIFTNLGHDDVHF